MRKQSANWYIAATHYLTAGFVIPILTILILGLFIGFLPILSPIVSGLFYFVVIALAVWLGVIYSANFLKKTYIVKNKDKIVNLSTIYLIILGIIGLTVFGFSIFDCIILAIMAVVFYLGSRRYIEETPEIQA